jgi:hypothetical protein
LLRELRRIGAARICRSAKAESERANAKSRISLSLHPGHALNLDIVGARDCFASLAMMVER